jgi:hypothetical protein
LVILCLDHSGIAGQIVFDFIKLDIVFELPIFMPLLNFFEARELRNIEPVDEYLNVISFFTVFDVVELIVASMGASNLHDAFVHLVLLVVKRVENGSSEDWGFVACKHTFNDDLIGWVRIVFQKVGLLSIHFNALHYLKILFEM